MENRRRLLPWAAAFVAGLVALTGSLRWDVPLQPVRERLGIALARDTGYQIASLGGASFTAFPWPVLQLTQLELRKGGGSAETASVPLVKARLNLFSWLANDPRITGLTLFEPRVNLVSTETMEETEAVATVIKNYLRSDRRPSLSSLRVQGGEVSLDGGRWLTGLAIGVSNVVGNDLRLTAVGLYRGQALRLDAVVASVAGAAVRPMSWNLGLGDLSASFRGQLIAPPALDADGRLDITLGAGALMSRPVSLSRDVALLLDGVSVRGEGRVALPQLVLRDAVVQRGPHRLQGAVDLLLSTTAPRMAATLHTETLDVTPLLSPLVDGRADAELMGLAFRNGWLGAASADIRLSARSVVAGDIRLERAALSAQLAHRRFELVVSEAGIGSGAVKGRLSLAMLGDRLEARATGQLDKVDLDLLQRKSERHAFSGIASGHFAVDAAGQGLQELAAAASGRGHVSVRNGEFSGLDADRFLRRTDPLSPQLPQGRSAFQQLDAGFRIEGGAAVLSEARLRGVFWSGAAEGALSLADGRVNLLARLWLESADPRREERSIRLEGPIQSPVVTPAGPAPFRRS